MSRETSCAECFHRMESDAIPYPCPIEGCDCGHEGAIGRFEKARIAGVGDGRVTRREIEFMAVVMRYIKANEVPTTTKLEMEGFGNGRTIRGNYVKIRNRMLEAAGYWRHTTPGYQVRWVTPDPKGGDA